jgi:predicted DsbA family dithiol-disulfide isomerase
VPTFIVDGKFTLSGAHVPEVLLKLLELGRQDDADDPDAEPDRPQRSEAS